MFDGQHKRLCGWRTSRGGGHLYEILFFTSGACAVEEDMECAKYLQLPIYCIETAQLYERFPFLLLSIVIALIEGCFSNVLKVFRFLYSHNANMKF